MPLTSMKPDNDHRTKKPQAAMSPPQAMLWSHLKKLKSQNIRFRRNGPVGAYIADFVCHTNKLIVELQRPLPDGDLAASREARRSAFLQSLGFDVLQVSRQKAMGDAQGIVEQILQRVKSDET
jgi:very-short-patch-repair endonuclease